MAVSADHSNIANTKIVSSETVSAPYWDDFSEEKNFHKILFRPGYAVQARELTQLQTILQAQVERFGNHIFQNGSLVLGGQMSTGVATYINLASQYINTDIDIANFIGKEITWTSNSRARAVVLDGINGTDTEPPLIAVKYIGAKKFGNGDTIKVTDEETYANIADSSSNGSTTVAYINEGIFFINGYFVKTPRQITIVDPYTRFANARVGLEFTDDIVDEDEDTSLLDPAQEASNYQAPGAHRYRIQLELSSRDLDSTDDEKFIELLRFENGVITSQVIYPKYSALGDTLARRTYDESGSYTVSPFSIHFKNHPSDDTKVQAILGPGKAYIKGFEYQSIADKTIDINRARTTANIQNYDLVCNYGNYFIGANLQGIFDTTAFALADMHCIPWQFISKSSGATYGSTKIGTCRVRDMIYYGAYDTSCTDSRLYKTSLAALEFTRFQTNVNAAATLTSNTVTLFSPSSLLSANDNAYNGATLKIRTNGTTGEYLISNYTGSTKVAQLNKDLIATPNSSSNAVISFDFGEIESIVINASYTPGSPSESANLNISTYSKSLNVSYLNETTGTSLLFKFPKDYIAYGSISDQDYRYRKKFTTTFSSNSATISVDSATEAFGGNVSGESASTLLEDYLVIGSSNQPVSLTAVSVDGTQTATLTSNNYNGTATVFASVFLNSGNNTNPKRKTLITGNTTHFVRHAANGTFLSTGSTGQTTNTSVYLVAGQVSITSGSRTPNFTMPLYISDVKRITKIYDLNGASLPAIGASITGYTNVINKFNFDDGQRDSYYDYARISLKPNVGTGPKGPLIVCFDYYDHVQGLTSDGLGYFSVDSYPNANGTSGYADIPTYTKSDGSVVELRDCIDFRPKRTNASNSTPSYTMSGIRIPLMNEAFESDFSYYLPRRDYIVISSDVSNPFSVLQGISAEYPQEPRNLDAAMVLYKLYLPPYTESFADITVKFIENKRYTMRDIGLLEKRVEHLEYYQSLSLLEKGSTDLLIVDEFGLERTKYGIIVDDFTGHGVGDVLNPDYKCGINKVTGNLTPAFRRRHIILHNTSNTNLAVTASKLTLDYTEQDFVIQPYATKYENVQPYAFSDWLGYIVMNPQGLTWIDTVNAPTVVLNPVGINDDYVGNIDGTEHDTEPNDAYENTTSVEVTHFALPEDRSSDVKETPVLPTLINRTYVHLQSRN